MKIYINKKSFPNPYLKEKMLNSLLNIYKKEDKNKQEKEAKQQELKI